MVKTLVIKAINAEDTLGTFITNDRYDLVIQEDTDLYAESVTGDLTEDNIIFKFRKNVFTKEECDSAYAGLREAATESQNRGLAAGPRGEMLGAQGRSGRAWVRARFECEVVASPRSHCEARRVRSVCGTIVASESAAESRCEVGGAFLASRPFGRV